MVRTSLIATSITLAAAQQAGHQKENYFLPFTVSECTSEGCSSNAETKLTIDANWRWVHKAGEPVNCYTGSAWDTSVCPDGKTCAQNCAVGAAPEADWTGTYGVKKSGDGAQFDFVTQGPYSKNVGSRTYVMEGDEYKLFSMLNKEIAFDVDMSKMPCGLNGAIYFAEMDKTGNKGDGNEAGAPYGTGYCDGQCARDLKWVKGEANIKNWKPASTDPYGNSGIGEMGSCCAEMDLWEGNMMSSAFTAHPATNPGLHVCLGDEECGSQEGDRYVAPTDRDGCDMNAYRQGDTTFYGPGSSFQVDTTKPFTFVTQFHASDGELDEIKQYYIQDGKKIEHPDTETADWCSQQKKAFGDRDSFTEKGGMKKMGEALDRGMVLVLSLWDDIAFQMNWLDSYDPKAPDPSAPGVTRGSCNPTDGDAATLRAAHPDSFYTVNNVKWGAIGSTHPDGPSPAPTPSPTPSPTPTPTPSDCPGGSLDACIDLCPPDAFAACVKSCQRRCASLEVAV
jgi:cellulose 1,4-beta-cellobiosidase